MSTIDSIRLSGVTYQLGETVSACTSFKILVPNGEQYEYGEITEFYINYNDPNKRTTTNSNIASFRIYNGNPSTTTYFSINCDVSAGEITAITSSDTAYTATIEDGQTVKVVLAEYCSLKSNYTSNQNNTLYTIHPYESGTTAAVMVDTVYDAIDKITDDIFVNKVTGVTLSLSSGNLILWSYGTLSQNSSQITLTSSTINTDGYVLNVHFSGQTASQKTLNVGSGNYCTIINENQYSKSLNDITFVINSGYTGNMASTTFGVRIINSSNSSTRYNLDYNISSNILTVPEALTNYATVEDTLSTNYTVKITPNEGYRIGFFNNNNCSIAGAEGSDQNNYICNLVTTTSYDKNGQDVIDEIFDTIGDVETLLSQI